MVEMVEIEQCDGKSKTQIAGAVRTNSWLNKIK